jgi:TPR repeat protein
MRSKRTATLLVAISLAWPCSVFGDFEKGKAANDVSDYAKAFSEWSASANAGDPKSQEGLGSLYDEGHGVPRDSAQAVSWYRKAAKQGDAGAQFALGSMYLMGRGLPQDDFYAVGWFRKASAQGNANAQFQLSQMYMSGKGLPMDHALGAPWLRKAAQQGFAPAQRELGSLLQFGWGTSVKQDDKEGFEWTLKAADQGDADAQYDTCLDYRSGYGVTSDDSVAQPWCRKSAEQGNADAQYEMGLLSHNKDAVGWYRKAAMQDHVIALYTMGTLCERGQGVPQDLAQASAWYEKAAKVKRDNGSAHKWLLGVYQRRAQLRLVQMYRAGTGVQQNVNQALHWMRTILNEAESDLLTAGSAERARILEERGKILSAPDLVGWIQDSANQGNAAAQELLGDMCAFGWGMPRDETKAFEWYLKAANQGNPRAESALFALYSNGTGVTRDVSQALAWGEKAAARDRASKIMLGAAFAGDDAPDFPKNEARAIVLFEQARAYRSLGVMYQSAGRRDDAKAKVYYQKAVDQGDILAMCNMALLYTRGQGIPHDRVQAYRWSARAVWTARAHGDSADSGSCDDELATLAKTMTPAELDLAESNPLDRQE